MLAPRELPPNYASWNRRWGAPLGNPGFRWPLRGTRYDVRRRGPFAWQANNSTREFEYPWAYEQIERRPPRQTIVDIGGSLGGMQFVLSAHGHTVITVDPGLKAGGIGWEVDIETHRRLCKWLGVEVSIISESLVNANLPVKFADVILSISSLEHFSERDLESTRRTIPQILKDDGVIVLTVDCFLDLEPFTDAKSNKWGQNISVYEFLECANLQLLSGERSELLGFPEFSCEQILRNLARYHVGKQYPCLAQCLTAKKKLNSVNAKADK